MANHAVTARARAKAAGDPAVGARSSFGGEVGESQELVAGGAPAAPAVTKVDRSPVTGNG